MYSSWREPILKRSKWWLKPATIFGIQVMGENLVAPDKVAAARRVEELGCDFVIHHIGYDESWGFSSAAKPVPSPLDQLREVVQAVGAPVQAVGGLSIEQAVRTPGYGAPLVVLGASLTIAADSFKAASGNLEDILRSICAQVYECGDIIGGEAHSRPRIDTN
jgi:3-hexulose-6-phosphate synthase